MSAFGVLVSDPTLQNKFTQVELRGLQSKFNSIKKHGIVTIADLPPIVAKLKGISGLYTEDDIRDVLEDSYPDVTRQIDFEFFLREYQNFQGKARGQGSGYKRASSMLRQSETTHVHTVSESEKVSHITHINKYLAKDPFLKKFLPIDPATNQLFDLAKDGVLMCKLINVAVPGTIDERSINIKAKQNPWERNENHTHCLNSAKAIGCTVVNIGTQDLVEGRPHLIIGLISQILKIHILADINLKKTPELVVLVEDNQDVEELARLSPEKILLKWMNFHLKKSGYTKEVTNFSTDLKDGEAYARLLGVLAPEFSNSELLKTDDPTKRANLIVELSEKFDCKGYISSKDITEGSSNLNLIFVAQIFHHRNGLSVYEKKMSLVEDVLDDEKKISLAEDALYNESLTEAALDDEKKMSLADDALDDEKKMSLAEDVLDDDNKTSLIEAPLDDENKMSLIEAPLDDKKKMSLAEDVLDDENKMSLAEDVLDDENKMSLVEAPLDDEKKMSLAEDALDDEKKMSLVDDALDDDLETSKDERSFRLWIDSLGINTYFNHVYHLYLTIGVNQKVIIILAATIIYWSLQKKSGQQECTDGGDAQEVDET